MKNKRLKATTRKWELLIINLHAGTSTIKLHLKETVASHFCWLHLASPTSPANSWLHEGYVISPLFFLSFFFFFFKTTSFLGAFFKLIFLKWRFSNLTPKNNVVLYFSSNLTVLTNGGGKNTTVR
jgi:hypothetical protein